MEGCSPTTLYGETTCGECARELAHGTTPRRGLGAIKGESDIVKLPTVIPSDRKEHCDWRESRNLGTEATFAIASRDSSTRYARSE